MSPPIISVYPFANIVFCKTEITMHNTDMSNGLYSASRRLRLLLWLGVLLAPLLTAGGLLGAWQGGDGPAGTMLDSGGLPLAWASALAILQSLLVAAALYQLAVLLGQVRVEKLFPAQTSRRYRYFAALLFVAAVVHGPLSIMLGAVLAPHDGAPVMVVDMADLLALLVTAVLWLVARFFDVASRLEEDQRSIV
ncbi:DUF2975 domain-containing protein [Stenotrophomonas sp. ISL-67]|uniref:DUF2975 domain-containing protein n=1 Tax=Stenotrophomonas sp. ISL-67 TaxID=2819171 RepID=UPI001BEBFB66|nr:DUF2975 domain-containing protein [Stenotrophomonas sp. ISL-67]MBT2766688.1 DUF2975 domain-containing protein [Stenotrophomonas sp. ISL-67]